MSKVSLLFASNKQTLISNIFQNVWSCRFDGQGYVGVSLDNYAPVEEDFNIKIKFRIAKNAGNGILLLMGHSVDKDFVSLELQNYVLAYSFNLGDR